jgi:RNA polymerase sigma-B factor
MSPDRQARDALIERHLPLARRLALRYRRSAEPVEDLIQVASLGLVKAAQRWDPDRGFAFSSFAVPTILGELRRHFRDSTWDVRPPRQVQELGLAVERVRNTEVGAEGRALTVVEIAEHLSRSPEDVAESMQAIAGRKLRSLDAPALDDDDAFATVGDTVGTYDAGYELAEARDTVERLLPALDANERRVLRMRFELDLVQSEIGEHVGCSQVQVSRILKASLGKLEASASLRDAA